MNLIELAFGAVVILLIVIFFVVKRIIKKGKEKLTPEQEAVEPIEATKVEAPKAEEIPTEETQVAEVSPSVEKELAVEKKVAETLKPAPKSTTHKNLPEDSMLRRHYVTHLHSMDEALHESRPTDSTLKRHHDAMIESEVEECLCDDVALESLECRYQAHKHHALRVETKKQTAVSPQKIANDSNIPEDSMLRRHYLTHLQSMGEVSRPTDSTLKCHHDARVEAEKQTGISAQKVEKISTIPQDSMLKRHYLTHIHSIVETAKGSRPTDSTLKRHYDTMIETEVEKYLESESCC